MQQENEKKEDKTKEKRTTALLISVLRVFTRRIARAARGRHQFRCACQRSNAKLGSQIRCWHTQKIRRNTHCDTELLGDTARPETKLLGHRLGLAGADRRDGSKQVRGAEAQGGNLNDKCCNDTTKSTVRPSHNSSRLYISTTTHE